MKKFAISLSTILIFTNTSFADLNNCNGTWTNKPCDALSKIPETKNETAENPDRGKKESLIHDLRMSAIESKREYEIRYDISLTEKICKSSSLEECDRAVKADQKNLQQLKTEAQLVKTKKERNELIKQSNELKKERNEIEANKPSVIIQQNTILVPPRRPPIWRNQAPVIGHGNRYKKNVTSESLNSDQSSSLPTGVR